ncbi:MAG: lactonase family protein [Eubacteriales bacterium]|nr:lactonase family protein [Eubacteriales bacterium]
MIYHVYAGSYMGEKGGDGIYLLELNTEKKKLVIRNSYPEVSLNPSFLCVTQNWLFSVSELEDCGYIHSFLRNCVTGELEHVNKIKTEGTAMCHLYLWPDGKYISAANYMSGSLVVCRVDEKTGVQEICDFKQHEGVGFENQVRQEGPHIHATCVSGDGKRLYASDLGLDQIFCYEILDGGKLLPGKQDMQIHTPKGTGPRHFVFSKDERFLYVLTEMGSKLLVYESEKDGESFREIQIVSTLPESFGDFNLGADIHFSMDERFLYTSNRGADSIAAFRVSRENGTVEIIGHYSCGGSFPRNFCITPDDRFVLIANQKSGNVVLCERNPQTGEIGEPLSDVRIPEAVFVKAVKAAEI